MGAQIRSSTAWYLSQQFDPRLPVPLAHHRSTVLDHGFPEREHALVNRNGTNQLLTA